MPAEADRARGSSSRTQAGDAARPVPGRAAGLAGAGPEPDRAGPGHASTARCAQAPRWCRPASESRSRDERAPAPARGRRRRRRSPIAYEDEHLLVVDKPAGVVVHPARGHRDRHARAGAGRAGGRRRGPVAGRDRPPPRPRHLGAAGRGQERRGPPRAEGAAGRAAAAPRVPGPGRRPSVRRGRGRSTRRSAATAATAC